MEAGKDQIELIRAYMRTVRSRVHDVDIHPRIHYFDLVILGLLSKGFSVAGPALLLIENEHPEEAYGLSRSLVECALNLRYLTQSEDREERENRALAFARYFHKEKQYWIYQAKQWSNDAEFSAAIDNYAAENNIVPDPKVALRHWSGHDNFLRHCVLMDHPLDGQTNTLRARKIEYALNYHATSAYVHCSLGGIEYYFPEILAVYKPQIADSHNDEAQCGQKGLYIILSYIHACTRYAMFGMEMAKTQEIDEAYRNTILKLTPIKPRYKQETRYRKVFF